MSHLRQRLSLYGGGVIALAMLWYFVLYAPTARQLHAANNEIIDARRELTDFGRTITELPTFLKANQNLETMRQQLNSSLYAKEDILELFRQLAHDADAFDLTLVQISPPVSELLELNRQAFADNNPLFLNITLDFKGRYVSFGQFVCGLETKPYFREVKSCVIRGQQTATPAIDLSLSFKALLGTMEESS